MRQRYQMLLSLPLVLPVFIISMIVVGTFNRRAFKHGFIEFVDIIKCAWKN